MVKEVAEAALKLINLIAEFIELPRRKVLCRTMLGSCDNTLEVENPLLRGFQVPL